MEPFYQTKITGLRPAQSGLMSLIFLVAHRAMELAQKKNWNNGQSSFHDFLINDHGLRQTVNWAFPLSAYAWLGNEIDLAQKGLLSWDKVSANNNTVNWPLFSDAPGWRVIDGYLLLKHKETPLRFENYHEATLEHYWDNINWLRLEIAPGGHLVAKFFKVYQKTLGFVRSPFYSTAALDIMGIGGAK